MPRLLQVGNLAATSIVSDHLPTSFHVYLLSQAVAKKAQYRIESIQ